MMHVFLSNFFKKENKTLTLIKILLTHLQLFTILSKVHAPSRYESIEMLKSFEYIHVFVMQQYNNILLPLCIF